MCVFLFVRGRPPVFNTINFSNNQIYTSFLSALGQNNRITQVNQNIGLDPQPWRFTNTSLGLPCHDRNRNLPCTFLQHPTSHALLTSPTPRQRVLVCGACIGTAQIGASLVAPLGFIFKRSSLRSLRDMIIIYTERKKQFHEYFDPLDDHHSGTPPYPF